MDMNYYEVVPPTKWRAGFTGEGDNQKPFYFHCADCDAETEIAGFLGTGPAFNQIGLIPADGGPFVRAAMFCQGCFQKRTGKEVALCPAT